jgi:hypothetical protein
MKTKKSLQKKIKRGQTSKKYNIIKQKGGGFNIGDDVINILTLERGTVDRKWDKYNMVIITGDNVRSPMNYNWVLKLYKEYESQQQQPQQLYSGNKLPSVSYQRFVAGQRFKHYRTGKQGNVLSFWDDDDTDEKRIRQEDPTHYCYNVHYDNGESDTYLHQDYMLSWLPYPYTRYHNARTVAQLQGPSGTWPMVSSKDE